MGKKNSCAFPECGDSLLRPAVFLEGHCVTGAQKYHVMEYLHGISSHCLLLLSHVQINGAVKRNLRYISGSFKVLIKTLKDSKIQVAFHLFTQLTAVTLEEKGENTGSEQLVMLTVLKRISFPGKEPKIPESEETDKGQSATKMRKNVFSRRFPNGIKGH